MRRPGEFSTFRPAGRNGSAGEAGPYRDHNLTGTLLAEVCREAAKGTHPKDVWATLSEGVR